MKMNIVSKYRSNVLWLLIPFFLMAVLFSSCSSSVNKGLNSSLMVENSHLEKGTGYYDIIDMDINIGDDDTYSLEYNTEDYNVIEENIFLDTYNNPLSTFSVDVDTASYSNIRRFLNSSQKPPVDAVRIEEMINYFTYDYPDADGDEPFSITTEIGQCPWNPENKLMLVGLQTKKLSTEQLPPSNLVFLIDVSGSMDEPNKLPLLKSAFKLLVDELDEDDRASIVVYAGAAGLVLDSTPGNEKDKILDALMNLEAGGSTAGAEGIKLAYDVAKKNFIKSGNNRVILATDGDFNVGISSEAELVRLIEKKRDEGIFLTVLGFGTGNYKDSKMESLADKGNGNYAYIDNIAEARKVLVNEMGATLNTVAKDVKIQVEFNPAKVKAYRLIGYENRLLRNEDFNNDSVDAGEIGAGHSVTALYEIVSANSDFEVSKVDELKYQKSQLVESDEIATVKVRYKKPDSDTSELLSETVLEKAEENTSKNLEFAAAVAEFGMLLRESKYKGNSSYDHVLEVAKQYADGDDGYRSEFVKLVEKAESIN